MIFSRKPGYGHASLRVLAAGAALALLCVTVLAACTHDDPVLGRDSIANLLVVEDHSQALSAWAERGIHDAVLVNLDTHDDMRLIPEEKIGLLEDLYRRKDWKQFGASDSRADRSLYHIGNWIYAGARLGVLKEVYWIVPYAYAASPDAASLFRRLLKIYQFLDEDISTFKLVNNEFRGTVRGIPVTLCGLESLPPINTPLLLSIDVDYFPTYSNEYKVSYLPALHTTFEALNSRHYRIKSAVVSYSVNGDFLQPQLRWVGEATAMLLAKPALIGDPPSNRLQLLQQVDNAYRSLDPAEMLKLMDQYPTRNQDPAMLLYTAYAHMLQGKEEKTFSSAAASCAADSLYCNGLSFLATHYYSKGRYQTAEKLFRAGFAGNPLMRNGLFQFAHCLRKLGKLREAITWYERDEALNGYFPTHFLIVETLLMVGDRQAAADALKIAVESLIQNPYAEVESQTTAHAFYAAIDFSERSGFRETAAALRSSPAVKQMFQVFKRSR